MWAAPSVQYLPSRVDEYQIIMPESVKLGTASRDQHVVADLHRGIA
jgi:hypothetical protein